MMRFAASVASRGPIKRDPSGKKTDIKCCDERPIKHNSPELALKEKLIAQPAPALAHLQTPA